MTKWHRSEGNPSLGVPPSQYEISDELAALWVQNGNRDISDTPWPDLEIVKAYFVSEEPVR